MQKGGGNRLLFYLSQVCVGWMRTTVVVHSLWPKQSLPYEDFWVELLDIFCLSFPLWCVGGDFNVIRRSSKILGDSSLTSSMRDFDDFIRDYE